VYRSTSSAGTYTAISTDLTAATYTDPASGLTNGTTYYYKVSASNANHQCTSAQSGATSVMSCSPAAVPTALKATVGTTGQVVLSWTESSVVAATQYTILRSSTSGGSYATAGTSTTTSFTNTGLTDGTTYYYEVSAQNGTGNACSSATSTEIAATPNNCTVFTSSGSNADSIPDTTASFCFVTCWDITGLGLSNMDGRTLTINGTSMNCASSGTCSLTTNPLPAKDHNTYPTNGGYTFQVSACPSSGTCRNYATLYWWGTGHTCQ
jgi:hypothetical protein